MILLLFAALATSGSSYNYSHFRVTDAEERKITSVEYRRCIGRSLYNKEAAQCIREEWNNVDQQLDAGYRAALATTQNARTRQQLRKSQRQWLRQSDQECSVQNTGGQTPFELAVHQCEIDELIRRVAWFRRLAGHRQRNR